MAILGLSIILLVALCLQAVTATDMVIDNNEFLLYNKYYHKARLRQWGRGWRDYGTYEHEIQDNQLWKFEPHPYKSGCYYIINEEYSNYRIANSRKNGIIVYKGPYYDDQLFKLVPSGDNDGFYYIYSCVYTNDRITKKGAGNQQVGRYNGNRYDDQLWKLVPRFQADIYTDTIFHFDNRQGSTDISREISVTTGVVKSTESSIRSTTTYTMSMEASIGGSGASSEFTQEIETSLTTSTTTEWSKTETIGFTIPAGKNFKVMQHKVKFEGVIPHDSCTLMTAIKIFESDSATFSDPDKFIM